MTERLYYDDPYCRTFDARVMRTELRDGRRAVWLDRSAFYPTSGGQPFDTGVLQPAPAGHGAVDVLDVLGEGDEVVHVVAGDAPLDVGQAVSGAIDWDRRFDHMQQHTGQHVLSATIVAQRAVPTVSVHLGRDTCTIDLARELPADHLAAAEDAANRVVGENRPVAIRYASAEQAATLGLRKPSTREGVLRLIDIEGVDLSACGGTHVGRTGAVGGIAILGWERFKGGQRIEFACGQRVVSAHRRLRDTVTASVRLLSVLPADLPAAIARLQTDARHRDKVMAALRDELAGFRASALADAAVDVGGTRWVFHQAEGDAGDLKVLAQAIVERPGVAVVLAASAQPTLVVVARAADVQLSCDALVRAIATAFGGRGGGRPEIAQAGGLAASASDVLARARALVQSP